MPIWGSLFLSCCPDDKGQKHFRVKDFTDSLILTLTTFLELPHNFQCVKKSNLFKVPIVAQTSYVTSIQVKFRYYEKATKFKNISHLTLKYI